MQHKKRNQKRFERSDEPTLSDGVGTDICKRFQIDVLVEPTLRQDLLLVQFAGLRHRFGIQ